MPSRFPLPLRERVTRPEGPSRVRVCLFEHKHPSPGPSLRLGTTLSRARGAHPAKSTLATAADADPAVDLLLHLVHGPRLVPVGPGPRPARAAASRRGPRHHRRGQARRAAWTRRDRGRARSAGRNPGVEDRRRRLRDHDRRRHRSAGDAGRFASRGQRERRRESRSEQRDEQFSTHRCLDVRGITRDRGLAFRRGHADRAARCPSARRLKKPRSRAALLSLVLSTSPTPSSPPARARHGAARDG
jgi:hypothetical protein